jgi:hypothetical protein
VDVGDDLRPGLGHRGPFGGRVAQEVQVGGRVHRLHRRARGGRRDLRHQAEPVEPGGEGGGARRHLEVRLDAAPHQEEARRVQFLGRMGEGLHPRQVMGGRAGLSMRRGAV